MRVILIFCLGDISLRPNFSHLVRTYFSCRCLAKTASPTPVDSMFLGRGASLRMTHGRLEFSVSLHFEPPKTVPFQDFSKFSAASSVSVSILMLPLAFFIIV